MGRQGTVKWWKLAAFLPAAVWYRVIWGFSAQTAVQSSGVSGGLLNRLLSAFSPAYLAAEEEIQSAAEETLSFFLRKGAHMTCYFLLAALLLFAWSFFLSGRTKQAGMALLFTGILAGVDEYHQTFVDGRSGTVRDVLVDLAGACIAVALWLLLRWIVARDKTRCFPWKSGGPVLLLCVLGMAAIPVFVYGAMGQKGLYGLCARFLENWGDLTAMERQHRAEGLGPVVVQALELAWCGLTGGITVFATWKAGAQRAWLCVAAMALFGGLTAVLTAGYLWYGAAAVFLGGAGATAALWGTEKSGVK